MESFLCVAAASRNGTTVVFLESLPTLSNVYEKVKIFEIIEFRHLRGKTDNPFGLKRLFSCINIPDMFPG